MTMDRNDLTSCAVKINGEYLEDLIDGFNTLRVNGREALTKLLEYNEYRTDGGIFDYSKYPIRDITVEYILDATTPEALREKNNQLVNLLGQEDADIQFNDEIDKFFVGSMFVEEPEMNNPRFIQGTYVIRCYDPFKYSTAVKTASAQEVVGNTATFLINYNGTYPARPVLQVEFANALAGGTSSEDGDCGYVAFIDSERNIIQLGNPDIIDMDSSSEAKDLINQNFVSGFGEFTASNMSYNQSITDTYWKNGTGQTLKYTKQSSSANGSLTFTNNDGLQNYQCSMVQRLASTAAQTGKFYCYMKDANNTITSGFEIAKAGNGSTATVKYYVNGKVRATENMDISLYNSHFGYTTRTATYKQVGTKYYYNKKTKKWSTKQAKKKKDRGATKIVYTSVFNGYVYSAPANLNTTFNKQGTSFEFKIGNLSKKTFTDDTTTNMVSKTMVIGFEGALHTNALHSVGLRRLQGQLLVNTPNIFMAGDVVQADCNDGSVYLKRANTEEGQYAPEYGALGNDWEPFILTTGSNYIECVWSSWVDSDYKPTPKIIYNEVFI